MKKLVLLSFFGFFYFEKTLAQVSTVYGKIFSDKECVKNAQLFVSVKEKDKNYLIQDVLLYQLMIPNNGTFTFNLKKNDYTFFVVSEDGCSSEKFVLPAIQEKYVISLYLKKYKRVDK